jgi:hypothetical protein
MGQRSEHAVDGKPEGSRVVVTTGSVHWRLPITRPPDADSLLFPWWIPSLFMVCALALGPWIVWLFITLPSREVARHWDVAWVGLDVGLAALLGGTGIAVALRSPVAAVLASMTAAVLLSDARPFLQRAGFHVEHRRLVPPEVPTAAERSDR